MKASRITTITARVTPEMKKRFVAEANKEHDKSPSDVLRDLVAVYLSNRDNLTKKEAVK